ncbi:MAG: AGE family epimerase/isomerase [Pseudomonadota bacterium]
MVDTALVERAKTAKDWMLHASLPFWADRGVHPVRGFRERLTMDATPIEDVDSRVRLQARQTFCFAFGKVMGWSDPRADELVGRGVDVLTQHCRRSDGLYGARMHYGGGLSVETADLYDTAFALLGFSWAHRIGAEGAAEAAAAASLAIDEVLQRPAEQGGFREALPTPDLRLQNPHMHLFESSLAFHEAAGDQRALTRAGQIQSLLETKFLTQEGALREVFDSDWGAAPGDRFEAGHQYEWVWLMAERARLTGQPISAAAEALYAKALALTGPNAEVALSHALEGEVLDATERTWGLTEALKAHLARMIQGDDAAEARAIETFDRMWSRHVDPAPEGGWLDKYGPDGQPDTSDMTAATGYHIYVAIAEMDRICRLLG